MYVLKPLRTLPTVQQNQIRSMMASVGAEPGRVTRDVMSVT